MIDASRKIRFRFWLWLIALVGVIVRAACASTGDRMGVRAAVSEAAPR